jgi:hypothetical protein
MVNIVSTNANPATLALSEQRAARTDRNVAANQQSAAAPVRDEAALDSAWLEARRQTFDALTALDSAIAGGREALGLLGQLGAALRGQDNDAASALNDAVRAALSDAGEAGAGLLAGDDLLVQLDADAAGLRVEGLDFSAGLPGALSAGAVDQTYAAWESALASWGAASRRLQTHASVLGAVTSAAGGGARDDLDADGARLLALQVSQTLKGLDGSIVSARPSSVLSLFRS